MVLEKLEVLAYDRLAQCPLEPKMSDPQQETLLDIPRRDADWGECLHELEHALDFGRRPLPHRGNLVDRRHQISVVVEVADDCPTDLS